MANAPVITLDNFKPIQNGGSYFLQGFKPKVYGNKNVLAPVYRSSVLKNSSDTGYTNMGILQAFAQTVIGTTDYIYSIDAGGYIFLNKLGTYTGEIHQITNTYSSLFPDIKTTKEKTLLVTTGQFLCMGYRFTADSASATSLTVDEATLYATYGIDDDAYNAKIYNLTRKEEYTNTTAQPTTTLNFTTAGTTPQAGDEFIVFVERKFDFSESAEVRQITLFGNDYYITNGNYLAVLQSDETTFAATEKALPSQTQATCIASNSDNILVGGNFKGSGLLLLWDGKSEFWNYKLELPKPVEAITPYNGNFIILSAGVLYWTDGYSLNEIDSFPDSAQEASGGHYNGLKVLGTEIFVVNNIFDYDRLKRGVYIYDFKTKGFSFCPIASKTLGYPTYDTAGGALYYFSSWNYLYFGTAVGLNRINRTDSSYSLNSYYAQFMIDLPKRMKISMVELNLSLPVTVLNNSIDFQTDIIVSIGDGRKGFYRQIQCDENSTTTKLVSTNELNYDADAEIGEQIEIVDGQSDNNTAGDKRFITIIADPGTSSVDYTLDRATGTAPIISGTYGMIYKLKTQGTKELAIQSLDLSENLEFPISDFYGDKLNLEVLFQNHTGKSAFALNVNSIKIY